MIALDLCCGKGGWTIGLQAAGWEVYGVDIEDMGGYPGKLVLADVREVAKDPQAFFPGVKFDLVTASPPCQEFSYRSFPFKRCRYLRDNVPPDKSIWNACKEIARKLGCPIVIENVRGAVRYMGPAVNKFGPFYLWGDVPALLPDGKPQKGFGRTPDKSANPSDPWGGFGGSSYQSRGKRGPLNAKRAKAKNTGTMFEEIPHSSTSSKSSARKEWSAKAAMIPFDLGYFIGCHFLPKTPSPGGRDE